MIRAPLRIAVALSAAVSLGGASVLKAGDDLPTGAQVLDNYIKSTGGKAAHQRIKNRVIKGTMSVSVAGQEMSISLARCAAAPNKLHVTMEMPGMPGAIEQGTDGKIAWMLSGAGAQVLDGEQADMMIRDAIFNKDLRWQEVYSDAQCVALTEFDGMQCYKVVLTTKGGEEETAYYEKDTWLQRGVESTRQNPLGAAFIVSKIRSYKEVSGVLFPHSIAQTITSGQVSREVTHTFDSIECNVDLPEDRFALPEQISAIVNPDAGKKNQGQEKTKDAKKSKTDKKPADDKPNLP